MQYRICRNCGFKNEYSDNYCTRCGLDLTDPSHYDLENDEVDIDGTENGEVIIRLWSVGLSKLFAVILTIITIIITFFLLNRYFGKTIKEGMRDSEIVGAVSDTVGYDISDLLGEEEAEPVINSEVQKETTDGKKNTNKQEKNNDFVLKNSNKKFISVKKLKKLSKRKLAIARNEIFARNGYTFKDGKWKKYFTKKSWYKPKYSADYFNANYNKLLNKYEKKNIKRIVKVEKMKEE